MIILKNEIADTGMKWGVYSENEEKIVEYVFQSRREGTEIGKKIVNLTLLRYAVLDCLYVDEMKIDFQIDLYEKQYIDGEVSNMIEYSLKNHSLHLEKPIIKYNEIYEEQIYPTIELNKRKCYIGYSGGKDSRLCYQLLQNRFDEIIKFKIDFDDEEFNSDYHESFRIYKKEKYDEISTRKAYERYQKNYYQEEDLHCCFAIPFFSVKENDAAYLSIGLQFDVSNYYVYNEKNELIQEYDLMETYGAIKKFEELLRYFGLKQFNIIEPLASVTSFAVYEILRREYGDEQLKQMGSCWTPQQDGSPCGKCLKCQRVAYIYKALGLKLSEHEKESLKLFEKSNVPLAYLFGSITCEKLLCKYDASELKHMLFIDDKVFDLDKGIHKDISEIYGLKIIENPLKPIE